MKKKLLIALLFNLGVISMSHANIAPNIISPATDTLEFQQLKYGKNAIAVGEINTSVTNIIAVKPDTAEFSVTYVTEGETPNDASNRNAKNMKTFNEYLNQLGISDDNLTTIGYQNYQQEQQHVIDNPAKRYTSTFTVYLDIDNKQFFDVVNVLDQNQINGIRQDNDNKYYLFKIQGTSDSESSAKQLSQQKYQLIVNQLNKLGINNISVASYDTVIASPESETVKKYYVQNTIKIKVNDFTLLGKIIAKAQELKMTVNNDMNYSVSESAKNAVLAKYEQTIYQELAAKATRLLGQQYQLGVPSTLNSTENSYDLQPRNYGYNRAMVNVGQSQLFEAQDIDIQAPTEFTISLTMSGTFEIIKHINR